MSVANLGGALNVFHVIQYEKATALIKTNSNPLLKKKTMVTRRLANIRNI